MKIKLTLFLLILSLSSLDGQSKLEGVWQGIITKGGIYTEDGYKFELYLEVDGKKLEGKSYIYLSDTRIIQMNLSGYIYHDRSIYLEEITFNAGTDLEYKPPFNRKYQLIYKRSIWESTLNGYWQEVRPDSFNEKRKRGRIFLKQIKDSKA